MSPNEPAKPMDDLELPPRPDMPDCCNGGCAQCVLDDYAEDMRRWRAAVAEIEALRRQRAAEAAAPTDAAPRS